MKLVNNIYANFDDHFENLDSFRIKIRLKENLFKKELLEFYAFVDKLSVVREDVFI